MKFQGGLFEGFTDKSCKLKLNSSATGNNYFMLIFIKFQRHLSYQPSIILETLSPMKNMQAWLQEIGSVCCLSIALILCTDLIYDIRCNDDIAMKVMSWCCRCDFLGPINESHYGSAAIQTQFKCWNNFLATYNVSQHTALPCRWGSWNMFEVSPQLWVLQVWYWGRQIWFCR